MHHSTLFLQIVSSQIQPNCKRVSKWKTRTDHGRGGHLQRNSLVVSVFSLRQTTSIVCCCLQKAVNIKQPWIRVGWYAVHACTERIEISRLSDYVNFALCCVSERNGFCKCSFCFVTHLSLMSNSFLLNNTLLLLFLQVRAYLTLRFILHWYMICSRDCADSEVRKKKNFLLSVSNMSKQKKWMIIRLYLEALFLMFQRCN